MHTIEDTREPGAGALPAKSDADTSDQVSQEAQKEGTTRAHNEGGPASSNERGRPHLAPRQRRFPGLARLLRSTRKTPRHRRLVASPVHTSRRITNERKHQCYARP